MPVGMMNRELGATPVAPPGPDPIPGAARATVTTVPAAAPPGALGSLGAPAAADAVRSRLKRRYGYEADDDEVQSILSGGEIKIRTRVPTLQRLKDEGLMTGYYNGKPTLERERDMAASLGYWGTRPTLAREQFEALYFGTGTGGRTTLDALKNTAERTGITIAPPLSAGGFGVEVARYFDPDTQQITDAMGLRSAKDSIRTGSQALGISLTEDEINQIVLGGTVSGKLIRTPQGRSVAVDERQVDLQANQLYGFDRIDEKTGEKIHVFGTAEMPWHMQNNSFRWQQLMEEGGEMIDPMTGAITVVAGRRKWELDKEVRETTKQVGGWVAVTGPDGKSKLVYFEGELGHDSREKALDRELTRREGKAERELRAKLSDNAISSTEKLEAIRLKASANESRLDRDLQKVLQNERLTSAEKLAEADRLLQTELQAARLTSSEKESAKARLHDINMKLGRLVVDESEQGFHWEYGSQYTPAKIKEMAADLGISEWQVQLLLEDNADFRKQVGEWVGIDLQSRANMKAADADRLWKGLENALDRQLTQTLQDERLSATDRLAKIERDEQRWTGIMGAVAGLGETAVKIWSANKLAEMAATRGLDAVFGDLSRNGGSAAFWKGLGASDAQAAALAGGGWAAIGGGSTAAAGTPAAAPPGTLGATAAPGAATGLGAKLGVFAGRVVDVAGNPAMLTTAYAVAGFNAWRNYQGDINGHLNDPSNVAGWTTLYDSWWQQLPLATQREVAALLKDSGAATFNDAGEITSIDFGDRASVGGAGVLKWDTPGRFTELLDDLYTKALGSDASQHTGTPRRERVGMNPFETPLRRLAANPGALLRQYWDLYSRDVFNKGGGKASVADVTQIRKAWEALPGAARSVKWNQAQPGNQSADVDTMLQDLAGFSLENGFMSKDELARAFFDEIDPILRQTEDASALTNDQRNLIMTVFDQASGLGSIPGFSPDRSTEFQAVVEMLKHPDRMPEGMREALFGRGTQADFNKKSLAELRNDALRESAIPGQQLGHLLAGMSEGQQRRLLWMIGNNRPLLTQDIDAIFGTTDGAEPKNTGAWLVFQDLLKRKAIKRYDSDVPLGSD